MEHKLLIESAAYTDTGKIRGNNEDNFYLGGNYKTNTAVPHMEIEQEFQINDERDYLTCAVCDGIGGIEAGEEASLAAVKQLKEHDGPFLAGDMEEYYAKANQHICQLIEERRGGQMGTTATVINIQGDSMTVGNIGDSRAYLFRSEDGKLERLTKDQTRAQQLIDAGVFTKEEMAESRQNHILSQYLGVPADEFIIEPEVIRGIKVQQEDIILLCSDGLTDMIKDEELQDILDQHKGEAASSVCRILGETALDHGGLDNVTIEILRIRNQ